MIHLKHCSINRVKEAVIKKGKISCILLVSVIQMQLMVYLVNIENNTISLIVDMSTNLNE